jgi:hypothetical protein
MTNTVRDYQIRCNSLALPGSTILKVDGMNGPATRRELAIAKHHYGVDDQREIMDPSGIYRVHWHWAASTYSVTWAVIRHYNAVFDRDGNKHDGGSPPEQQAIYSPPRFGVSHTFRANTHAVGLSVAAMAGAKTNWGTGVVDQGQYPLTWAAIDGMLEETVDLCREFDIKPSPWTTITHCEVQTNIGIKQKNKWDIRVLPCNPTKLLSEREGGDILRARMMEKFW